jgi:predicted CXXCH cytochrome family protein
VSPRKREAPSQVPAPRRTRRQWLAGALLAGLALALGVTGAVWVLRQGGAAWLRAGGRGHGQAAFVDDRACARCHHAEFQAWSGSHHAKAMQPANATTVLGDFNDARFSRFGVTSRFFTRGGKFLVNTEGADGRLADFEITYTFGVEPLQQYLVELPGGRLQSLTIAWDTVGGRWFSLYPGGRIPPEDPLHWTGRYQNWNLMCAQCHTTNLRKGYDPGTDSYKTRWDALNVGCQACHGPGRAHAEWAGRAPAARPATQRDAGLLVDFRARDSHYEVDACARCHSRRTPLGAVERPGHPFLDEFRPEPLRTGLYYPDGQQLGEVYEWGSFRLSRMYQRGVRCTDCHDPHTAKLRVPGNAVCTRCHGERLDARFSTLVAKNYDSPAHHFHAPGSAGARCVECHMPAKRYMTVDPRRDHGFQIPRPDLSVKLGTPTACISCHAARSPQWAAAVLRRRYGPRAPEPSPWAEAIAAGRAGARGALHQLIALVGDATQPAIVRATALGLLRAYGPAAAQALVAATRDEDVQVRAAAVGGLDVLAPRERLLAVAPILKDPVRAVRIEAARVLASVPAPLFAAPQRREFEAALGELKDSLRAIADMPAAHASLGALYASLGQHGAAEGSYRTALRMDPYLLPARTGLAALYNAMGRNAEAERELREGIERAPRQGDLHYSLGLLLVEEKRLAEAAQELGRAAELLPDRARVRYNDGLTLQQLGRRRGAEQALLQANRLDPTDAEIVYALAVFYIQQQQYRRALRYAERLSVLMPTEPGAQQLLERLRRQLRAREPQRE